MKAKVKILVILVGVSVALITAGVPDLHYGKVEKKGGEIPTCYSETEVKVIMETTNISREQAIEMLNMACAYSVKPR